jgi:hypothetical protein
MQRPDCGFGGVLPPIRRDVRFDLRVDARVAIEHRLSMNPVAIRCTLVASGSNPPAMRSIVNQPNGIFASVPFSRDAIILRCKFPREVLS